MRGTVLLSLFALGSGSICLSTAEAANCPAELLKSDIKIEVSDARYSRFLRDIICVASFEEFSKKFGADTGASYFAISGFGNFTSDNYSKVRKSKCSDRTEEEAFSAFSYSYSEILPTEARQIMSACAARSRLTCELHADEGAPSLTVHFHTDQSGRASVYDLQNTNTKINTRLKIKGKMNKGQIPIGLEVEDIQKPAKVIVSVEQNDGVDTCQAFLPPSLACTQSLDGAVEKTFDVKLTYGGRFGHKKNPLTIDLGANLDIDKVQVLARDWGCPTKKLGKFRVHTCGKVDHAALAIFVDGQEVGFKSVPYQNGILEFPIGKSLNKLELRSLHRNRYREGEETYIQWVRVITKPKIKEVCQ